MCGNYGSFNVAYKFMKSPLLNTVLIFYYEHLKLRHLLQTELYYLFIKELVNIFVVLYEPFV